MVVTVVSWCSPGVRVSPSKSVNTDSVLIKFLITVVAFVSKLQLISYLAGVAAQTTPSAADAGTQMELVLHSGGGLLVLLVPAAMSVYKPRGMTRHGQRKQYEQRTPLTGAAAGGQHD